MDFTDIPNYRDFFQPSAPPQPQPQPQPQPEDLSWTNVPPPPYVLPDRQVDRQPLLGSNFEEMTPYDRLIYQRNKYRGRDRNHVWRVIFSWLCCESYLI